MAKIYLSFTYSDLRDYRDAVAKILRKGEMEVVFMEDYVATGQGVPLDQCLADVARCDGYMDIFAWRYGYIPTANNPDQKSITELEYRQAQTLGKPCFIFLLDENIAWPPKQMDQTTGEGERSQRIVSISLRRCLPSAHRKRKSRAASFWICWWALPKIQSHACGW